MKSVHVHVCKIKTCSTSLFFNCIAIGCLKRNTGVQGNSKARREGEKERIISEHCKLYATVCMLRADMQQHNAAGS